MKEVKSPKKPLIYYYGIVLLIILLFNLLITPLLSRQQVTEVDYGTFMDMIDDKDIGTVQVEDSQILFTDKEDTVVYKTSPMEDPTLAQRLHEAGARFDRVIEEPISPIWSFLLTFVLPILIFVALGQYMNKKLMEQIHEDEKQKRYLELKAMQYQINPHFLYNTLDSIAMSARRNQDRQSEEMTHALAEFCGLPAQSRKVHPGRGRHAQRYPAGRPSRHR